MARKDDRVVYDYDNGEICFIAAASGKPCHRQLTDDVRAFLRKKLPDMSMKEREIVGLNRWIMNKDTSLDLHNIKSEKTRSIAVTDTLYGYLARRR